MAAIVLLASCNSRQQDASDEFVPREINITGDRLTPEILWSFTRVGNVKVSPDSKTIIFTATNSSIEENRNYSDICSMPVEGGKITLLTSTPENEFEIGWRPDGKKITFMSAKTGEPQLFEMNPDGTAIQQVTFVQGGISTYLYSPDMSKLLVVRRIKMDKDIHDLYPDLPKANARIEDDLMYRHWDHWSDYSYNHIFVASYNQGKITSDFTDIMEGEHFDSPLQPFGGIEQICWNNESSAIVYTSKKLTGKKAAFSTNSDLYLYDLSSSTVKNLSEGGMGYDINPSFSPDGTKLIWEQQPRDGYEADQRELMMMDMATGTTTCLSSTFDRDVQHPVFSKDGKNIWFTSNDNGTEQIFRYNTEAGEFKKITNGTFDYTSIVEADGKIVATRVSMSHPGDIYLVDKESGESTNITGINEKSLSKLTFGNVEERWIKTTDNKDMLVWVIYPPHFDKNKKYPALLYCQGGPQSTVSQFWSLRWNFQMMAANDYIIVAPNRRGVPGFGQEWNEQISGDYGGQNMKDYLSAIDAVAQEPFVDRDHLGAVGASYGGFSVYWLAGNHNKRFKAFISHCGIFNFEQMYSTTEEMFFVNWDLKGNYWDTDNKTAMRSFANSPHKFVKNWDTPILVIHGEQDFRIPYTQGMGAFNTAIMRDIKARFLFFPEENHWVLRAQNGILWHREFFRFLDENLKQ
jgi:dipeptidyl aminopeptidase/acylaminoacyl peptidase